MLLFLSVAPLSLLGSEAFKQRFTIFLLVNRKGKDCDIRRPQQIHIEKGHRFTHLSFCSRQLSPCSLQLAGPNDVAMLIHSALIFLSEKTFPYALETFLPGTRGNEQWGQTDGRKGQTLGLICTVF